jgi:hypothetical protein
LSAGSSASSQPRGSTPIRPRRSPCKLPPPSTLILSKPNNTPHAPPPDPSTSTRPLSVPDPPTPRQRRNTPPKTWVLFLRTNTSKKAMCQKCCIPKPVFLKHSH